jgi:hypothetical protein
LESSIDSKKVEFERGALLAQMLKKLDQTKTEKLLSQGLALRSGQMKEIDFYEAIFSIGRSIGLSLNSYPSLVAYRDYLRTADAIDAEKIYAEVSSLEKTVFARLVKTDMERQLIRESRRLFLTQKLVHFGLNPHEWEEYKNSLPDKKEAQANLASWIPADDLFSFESFYMEAEARDEVMANNLLRGMKLKNSQVAVLVTGGFHARGIQDRLKKKGYSIISLLPGFRMSAQTKGAVI